MKYRLFLLLQFPCLLVFAQNESPVPEWQLKDTFYINMRKIPGKEVPGFSARSLVGTTYTEDSLKNKVTLLNCWFENCPPCVAEFDALNNLYDTLSNNKNFRLLAFTFETPEVAAKVREKYHLRYELICVSKNEIYTLNFKYGFPTNLIIDTKGKVAYFHVGGGVDTAYANKFFKKTILKQITSLLPQ